MARIDQEHPSTQQRGEKAVGGKEAGEASRVSNHSAVDTDEDIPNTEWIEKIATAGGPSEDSKICMVPEMLRANKDLEKYYDPRVVSIGPYHHKTRQLRKCEIKRKMARELAKSAVPPSSSNVQDGAIEKKIKGWHDQIMANIEKWRECYPQMEELSDRRLGRMMLLDGCFVVYYIANYDKEEGSMMTMKSLQVITVKQDLFLLENQIPFEVLETLLEEKAAEWKEKLHNFINFAILSWPASKPAAAVSSQQQQEKPLHLLDLLRRTLLQACGGQPQHAQQGCYMTLRNCCWSIGDCGRRRDSTDWHSFRNIEELKEVGIWLKPSKSHCLKDVVYEPAPMVGYLRLPPITVDDSTAARFLNLIAYEMCPRGPDESAVTSYICFLDSLIDKAEDVREMRKARVLHNFLGSDQEVAELFNKIATDLVVDEEMYKKVKQDIQRHCDCKIKSWAASFIHTHFSTPWTFLAFLAAAFALFLSGVQAYYSWKSSSDTACDGLCTFLNRRWNPTA